MNITIFTDLFNAFDKNVLQTINTGSAQMISLISPLAAVGFSIYVLLVLVSYWRGHNDQPIVDFMMKMAGWAAVLTAGMNIGYYSEYVVPFFNGIGDDIGQALTGGQGLTAALDNLLNLYIQAIVTLYKPLRAIDVGLFMEVTAIAFCIILAGVPFIAIAAAYIILAKFALGLLLALGPLFIVALLFPVTRRFFDNWVGQCLNYGFLVALFATVGALEVSFATSQLPTRFDLDNAIMTWQIEGKLLGFGFVFLIISLNLPSLASQLAGGVGLSSMVGNIGGASRAIGGISRGLSKMLSGRRGGTGGTIS
ncbi:type IV secretion system protein [Burkholderia alba]|uniref:type IV secretion system protein n=1 Tax=Burkholderia alba TaxID=2683677 RepID=UPI002B05DA29|nr:type IV secretion system protein [Burkholderia alba]